MPEQVSGRRDSVLVAALLGPVALAQLVGLVVAFAVVVRGAAIAASNDRVDAAGSMLVDRVRDAAPLVDELRALGADTTTLEASLDAPRGEVVNALAFVREAGELGQQHARGSRHEARLVQQRIARLRDARAAFAEAWAACESLAATTTGRWALTFGVTGAACEPLGEP